MVIIAFNHVITFKNENNCFKLVINLISNLHLLISWISLLIVLLWRSHYQLQKLYLWRLSLSPFNLVRFLNFCFCSKKMLKHCLKNFGNERLLLKLEMIENLKESVSMKVKNYSSWPSCGIILWLFKIILLSNLIMLFVIQILWNFAFYPSEFCRQHKHFVPFFVTFGLSLR